MRQYKPFHVTVFTFFTLLILLGLSLLVTKNGIQIGDKTIRFLSFERVIFPKKEVKKNIDALFRDIDTTLVAASVDTTIKHQNQTGELGQPSGGKLAGETKNEIYLSAAAETNLSAFFERMDKLASEKKKIHILHYGDSQIEGDRMTAFIRQRLQEQFGGNGPGLIPAVNVYNTNSFKQKYSPNFERFTGFGGASLANKGYGALISAARFTPEYKDSASRASAKTIKEAWIEIEPSKSAYGRARVYNQVKLFYSNCVKPCGIKVFQNEVLIHEDSLLNDGKYHSFPLSFQQNAGKLKYVFTSAISPNIIGFSLEGDFGVQMDNIAMRGSSGTFFGKIDQGMAAKMYQDLNADLFIMQFGGNSVPYFTDTASVKNYVSYFKGQLQTIKRLRPSAAILVIGPSDMSRFQDGMYTTYPLLPVLVRKMQKACGEVGAGYWDLFAAMGGENSMPAWVDKGLAGKDYIHFSPKGASIASQLFYDAFAAAYAKWKTK